MIRITQVRNCKTKTARLISLSTPYIPDVEVRVNTFVINSTQPSTTLDLRVERNTRSCFSSHSKNQIEMPGNSGLLLQHMSYECPGLHGPGTSQRIERRTFGNFLDSPGETGRVVIPLIQRR